MRAYPPDSKLLAVHPGTPQVEKRMHSILGVSRVAGREWYEPSEVVMAHIDRVVEEFGPPPKRFMYEYRKRGIPAKGQQTKPRGYVASGGWL
jgi:hypothetical protein